MQCCVGHKSISVGMADFISLKVEAVKPADIFYRPLLPLSSCQADSVMAGRKAAVEELVKAGVSTEAAAAGISSITTCRTVGAERCFWMLIQD